MNTTQTTSKDDGPHSGERPATEPTTLPAAEVVNLWDLVRRPEISDLREPHRTHELQLGDVFEARGKRWLHAGWYSAVYHTCGLASDGERKVIAHVEEVLLVRRATTEEAQALRNAIWPKEHKTAHAEGRQE